MKTLFISPSYHCNEKCVFCPCSTEAKGYNSLTLDEAVDALNRASQNAVSMVLISGGEPTLWKHLLPFISKIKEKGLKWGMLSNSTTFSVESFADKFLKTAGSDFELTTAFHSHLADEHDAITGMPGSFARSIAGIGKLLDNGVAVTIKHVINNLTYRKLPDYAKWVNKTFPPHVPWIICNMDICGVAENNRSLTGVSFRESRPQLEAALDIMVSEGSGRIVRVFNTPLCCIDPYYWKFLQKYESEEEMAALALPYKPDETFKVKFNLKGDGGANFPPCFHCELRNMCPGTWKNTAEILGYDSFTPFHSA